jgi:hypothetical protein
MYDINWLRPNRKPVVVRKRASDEPEDYWLTMAQKHSVGPLHEREGLRIEHIILSPELHDTGYWTVRYSFEMYYSEDRVTRVHWSKIDRILTRMAETGWEIRDSVALYCGRGRIVRYD